MATKNISISLDVYERLKQLKSGHSETFSQVLRRELGMVRGIPASELLRRSKLPGGLLGLSEEQLQEIEESRKMFTDWGNAWTR